MIDVVVAIIVNQEGKTLIAKRKQGKIMGGCWEFPGGKSEPGESLEFSVMRELKEEMDIDVSVGKKIAEIDYTYKWGKVHLIAFQTDIVRGEIKLLDHDEIAWVSMDEMSEYGMTPADEPLIDQINEWIERNEL
mgnify:CR=1 FL=1